MLRKGDILGGRYRIDDLIGRGGMSNVWKARDLDLNIDWAVKEIDKHTRAFKELSEDGENLPEFNTMAKLSHNAFPRITDMIHEPGALYIVMDYIQGETLYDILDYFGTPPVDDVVSWMIDLCDALDYLHHLDPPIVHGDIKPTNIMFDKAANAIRVIDMAAAIEVGKSDIKAFGTKGYAAPEQYQKKLDERSDVYMVGMTLYQLLTGENPVKKGFVKKTLSEISPGISTGLEKIVNKATEEDPEKRYQTVQDLADALASYKKLDDEYIEGLKGKIRGFRNALIACGAFFLIGASLLIGGIISDNRNYDQLLNSETSDLQTRISELEAAIDIKPKESAPYIELIKTYAGDGVFTEKEVASVSSVYTEHKDSLKRDSKAFSEVSYEIGEALLKYYTGETDSSTRAKLLVALPYFENVSSEGFNKYTLAKSYSFMGRYYKDYVIADTTLISKDASIEDYLNLLKESEGILDELSSYQGDTSGKIRLITCDIVLSLLDNQRNGMVNAGIEKDEVLPLIEKIEDMATNIDSSEVVINEMVSEVKRTAQELKDSFAMSYKQKEKR